MFDDVDAMLADEAEADMYRQPTGPGYSTGNHEWGSLGVAGCWTGSVEPTGGG